MEVLKTTPPQASPSAAHDRPRKTRPSSRARIAGFIWRLTVEGFGCWLLRQGFLKEQFADRTGETGQQRRSQCIGVMQRGNEPQGRIFASINFDESLHPAYYPIFDDTAPRIEVEFDFAVALLVGLTGRKHFDDQLRCYSQMTGFINCIRESVARNPNDIRRHVIILAKDQTWGGEHGADFAFEIPLDEKVDQKTAGVLVFVTRLSGHVEFSADDLVALAVIRHQRQLTGSKFFGNCGIVTHDFDLWIESSMSAETTQNTPYAVLERIVLL